MSETNKLVKVVTDFFTALEALALNAKQQITINTNVNTVFPILENVDAPVSTLVFNSYQGKVPATEKENGWTFSDLPEVTPLLAKLKINGGKIRIGHFEYSISKGNGKFIGRKFFKT